MKPAKGGQGPVWAVAPLIINVLQYFEPKIALLAHNNHNGFVNII
jgi:hypothetical protein